MLKISKGQFQQTYSSLMMSSSELSSFYVFLINDSTDQNFFKVLKLSICSLQPAVKNVTSVL